MIDEQIEFSGGHLIEDIGQALLIQLPTIQKAVAVEKKTNGTAAGRAQFLKVIIEEKTQRIGADDDLALLNHGKRACHFPGMFSAQQHYRRVFDRETLSHFCQEEYRLHRSAVAGTIEQG